jgi:uncharacterized BrkB/YihY/UPF0761 family membrane protein
MSPQPWWGLLKDTGRAWMGDKLPRLAVALAFSTILSAGPLLVIALAVAAIVFGQPQEVRNLIVEQFSDLLGPQGGEAIRRLT